MTWTERIKEAAYTSPSGTRITFMYEDVSRSQATKTTVFDFTDADGSFVQDLGRSGRRYPMRFIFSGANCDTEADQMEAALSERGQGTLEHPVYGSILVVPVSEINRTDSLVSAANQAIVEVELMETNRLIYPAPVADVAGTMSILDQLADAAQAAGFDQGMIDSTVSVLSELKADYEAAQNIVAETLGPIADAVDTAQKLFTSIQASINNGLDVLIDQPLTLAYQTIQLIKTPARIVEQVSARINASANQLSQYATLSVSSSGSASSRVKAFGRITAYSTLFSTLTSVKPETNAVLQNRDLHASSAASSMAVAAVNTSFDRRRDAVSAAEIILDTMDRLSAWRDENYQSLGIIDDGSSWQTTQQIMATAAGVLVDQSFDLLNERRIVISSDRSIIDLCFELYGSVDDILDDFMGDNDFSGDEIIEIKRGREIIYYV